MGEKGNDYWKIREKDGKDKLYTPEELLKGANDYFEWCIANPWMEAVIVNKPWTEHFQDVDKDGKTITRKVTHPYSIAQMPKVRVFTLTGLCSSMGIVVNTFRNYEKADDYVHVTTHARQIIATQKFEGAASGFFQQSIIAQSLGLVSKQDLTTKGKKLNNSKEITVNIVKPKK